MSIISRTFKVDGVPTNMTSVVVEDPLVAYGVKRNDTGAVVVTAGTAMTNVAAGEYTLSFIDPAYDLTYTYYVKFEYDGETHYFMDLLTGPVTPSVFTGLVTVAKAKNLLKIDDAELKVDCVEVYHPSIGGVATATVEVTATTIVLTDNVTGVNTFTLSTYSTVSALSIAIRAALPNWSVTVIGLLDADPTDLIRIFSTDCFTEDNEVDLPIVNNWLIEQLIIGVSRSAERICGRTFIATDYCEQLDGNDCEQLLVSNYPIIAISSIATSKMYGIKITNTSTTASEAFVKVSTTTLTLTVVDTGVETVTPFTLAGYALLSDLIDAINLLGSGWQAVGLSTVPYRAIDLIPCGGFTCLNLWGTIAIPLNYLVAYTTYSDEGILNYSNFWPSGNKNIVVRYRAGYETIPEDLQRLVAKEVGVQYADTRRNLSLKSETLGDYKWVAADLAASDRFEKALSNYIDTRLE